MSKITLDNMILTKDAPTTAGSKMLDGFMSLFDAECLVRLADAGYTMSEKTAVGEFAIDLLGESEYKSEKSLKALKDAVAENFAGVCLDVNGYPRRVAAQNDLVSIKPTYGTVSRYGTIPVACSGETVSVVAKCADNCKEVLAAICGHDDKDGTSLSEAECTSWKNDTAAPKRIALSKGIYESADADVKAKIDALIDTLKQNGVEVSEIDDALFVKARIAWNILMSAELCNNVSRYDGVKYGYRANDFTNIDEMYTNTRTEAFGDLLKTAIIFGSETLSTDNYFKVYDKALRVRRVIKEAFDKVFADDTGHVCGFKYFNEFRKFAELSDVLTGKVEGRTNDEERILSYNIGLGLHDLIYADKIFDMLKDKVHDFELCRETQKFWI